MLTDLQREVVVVQAREREEGQARELAKLNREIARMRRELGQ